LGPGLDNGFLQGDPVNDDIQKASDAKPDKKQPDFKNIGYHRASIIDLSLKINMDRLVKIQFL
jgi:hypothetical protein